VVPTRDRLQHGGRTLGVRALSRRDFLRLAGAGAAANLTGAADWTRHGQADLVALTLGSVQDGGLPQAGCYTERCERARNGVPRYVASLALIEPAANRYYLVDASPDLPRQMDLVPGEGFRQRAAARRPFDGIFLTHAHMGHYLGLAHLGREALGTAPTRCYCTERMASFLRHNGPWSLMVEEGRLVLDPLTPDAWRRVSPVLSAKAIPVPHRDEYTDTVAFIFRGPRRALLYLPDIDRWSAWSRRIEDVVGEVDVALLDGSFYSAQEVPGRSQEEIPHPLMSETMSRLAGAVRRGRRVIFTHLNNSNPALDEGGPAERAVLGAGFGIAREGETFEL